MKEHEAAAKDKAQERQAIIDSDQKHLDESLPALEASIESLDALEKNDISELCVYIKHVMEGVCLLVRSK